MDHEIYWTCSPKAVWIEKVLKFGGTAAIAAATWALIVADTTVMETGWKTFALMGALIPIVLWWDLTSLCTRRSSRLRVEALAPAIFFVASAFPILWSLFHALWSRPGNQAWAMVESLGLLLFAQPLVLASWTFLPWVGEKGRSPQAQVTRRWRAEAETYGELPRREARGAARARPDLPLGL